jgi:type IV pilus assembly protein PilY1
MKAASALYGVLLVIAAAPADSAVTLSDAPLFLTVSVPPNLTVTLDDSGSMARAFVPDLCGVNDNSCNKLTNRYVKSSYYNPLYYNPNIKYPAAKDAAGADIASPFTNALRNGFDSSFGTVNLSNDYRPTAYLNRPPGGDASEDYMSHYNGGADVGCSRSWCQTKAYYYVFDKSKNGCGGAADDNDCYKLVFVTATSGPATVDLNGDGVTDSADRDETQNFANWFSFYRTRNLATTSAASVAFSKLDSKARVAWQALNSCYNTSDGTLVTSNCKGTTGSLRFSNAMRPFAGTQKTHFYTWLGKLPTNDSTPLPDAMTRAGEYYRQSGANGPYLNDYSGSSTAEYACRRNYHIMMTDGIWNTNHASPGNLDGKTITLPDNPDMTQYDAIAPYKDNYSNTLADVAFKYWVNDLRKGTVALDNNLLPILNDRTGTAAEQYWNPRNDPATWQHMVNFTIGLGLSGYLSQTTPALTYKGDTYSGSYSGLADGTIKWPQPSSDTPANVSDLWHAAIDSRGQFFSAEDPAALGGAFQTILTAIAGDAGSAAALSANSTSVQPGNTIVYQARFNRDWSGGLIAYPVDADGVGPQLWDASTRIPQHDTRRIYTYNGTAGIEFSSCSNLGTTERNLLDKNINGVTDGLCDDRLSWLRGNSANEQRNSGGVFRNRITTVMGDIINSDPAYVASVDYHYDVLPASTPGQSTYASFVSANASRMAMVYVGANDGRVYGIRADKGADPATPTTPITKPGQFSGSEVFSYIPRGVFPNLSRLTDPSYSHRYYADGAISVRDAYLDDWKTVLVAGLNAGGKSIYALDITDPGNFDASKVMWEFDDHSVAGDGKTSVASTTLGLTFSQPQIGILQNGTWVAVFGNGYNSTDGGAYLYVVDLKTGALLARITAKDDAGDEGNGLSTPALVDAQGDDKLMDTVYAGDLNGNLWKFDLSDANPKNWKVAYSGAPLFRATDSTGNSQPITVQPQVTGHPLGGKLVVFGTGRYLASSDVFDKSVQSFYGIRDSGAAVAGRSDLQVQTIQVQTAASGLTVRALSTNTVDWSNKKGWYLDLLDPPVPPGTATGERVVSTAVLTNDRAIFVTVIPSDDPCVPGGTSWLMEASLATGGTFDESILDINKDGKLDDNDRALGEVVSGQKLDGLGISKTPILIHDGDGGSDGGGGGGGGGGGDCFEKAVTGTTGRIQLVRNCTKGKEETGSVTRRSWIQIR